MRKVLAAASIAAVSTLATGAEAKRRELSPGCYSKRCTRAVCTSSACRGRVQRRRIRAVISSADAAWLRRVRLCESTDNYTAYNPDGPFYGAYQFTLSSWAAVGGSGDPRNASPHEQDVRALRLRALQGTGAWPNCG
jgi:hypothetical protein